MQVLPITSDAGILATLTGVCALFFWLEKATRWRLFNYVPPLVFIYLTPVILSNSRVIPVQSPVYDKISKLVLPVMLMLMLLNVDVLAATRTLGRGVVVMVAGSAGVVLGAAAGAWLTAGWLGPSAWKAYGALSGSWVGGTGNMLAVAEMFDAGDQRALAVLADTSLLLVWLPLLLTSKRFAESFARFAKADPQRLARLEAAHRQVESEAAPSYRDYLYLLCVALAATAACDALAPMIPEIPNFATASTWRILLITTCGVVLSFTPLRRIPGSRQLGMALIFLFMAQTGATADLSGLADQAAPFLLGAAACLAIHGAFCLAAARLLHIDIHTAAIASAANVGGVATATVVAEHHRPSLTPAAILMALLGYALGNYAGYFAGLLCRLAMSY
ncbi:MAG: hypothetical protein DCC67_18505 [Planctomycetota bacterium]|nr:MAG: hypothetical protein DCC67_18505 [Planctomycetota bacterium]